ncbi:ArsC/Spx/MgsR family protein [Echinicola jeungdonensis]|uniref:Arsenate reductase family protein n=1 Tax=Echinicola jeungdonensis TaxID=709343 RepID=A0ABV5J5J9_9BACT|nr:ArsC/Spx/MgsR family protein [Echinicola jeungdonensis]MDN3670914.1 ArsC/Spx/MgsR family protein [Echinicola jeungdonensis]
MEMHPNELFFYYIPTHSIDKQARAYARSISRHVHEINIEKEKITSTGWKLILDMLNLRAKDILNKSHPEYQSMIAGKTWDEEGWLNILVKHPYLIKAPIAIKQHKAVLCTTPTEILKLN